LCTNEQWRASVVGLEETARTMTARFRASMAGHPAGPVGKVPLRRLQSASPEFREAWDRHEVVSSGSRVRSKRRQIRNAHVGLLALDRADPWLGPGSGPRMVTYVPVDDESRARLTRLQESASRTG
ncbi:XRE family transcriptional regulator, partial [Streptomyces sp. NPDC096153]